MQKLFIKCITTVYYLINNFCKVYLEWEQNKLLPSNKKRQRDGSLSLCELMTIVLYFYSPFGGENLHLPDGKALACLMRHDAIAS